MPVLLVERGNDKGLSLKIEPAKSYVVGRENEKASFQLNDPMASRAHFQISALNGTFRIKDMKSRNGTKLNDEKLAPDAESEIKVGDKIQVGETIFSFLSDEKEESTTGGLIGKTIGGYKLLERVGRGGMGTVYKAEQISLSRVVALKVLSAKLLSDPVFVEKFVQEARAAGGLTHPNIVQVIDVGNDRGIYFFSMEFLDNGSVGDVATKEGKVSWERALEMMTDAVRGLIFAEKRGIIHRDIKPDNLMLTSEGAVKIGDLGLAKKAEDVGGDGGQIFGTPHFIAPEQAQGKPIDNRADIYALGATFYRVLAGKTPFSGDNVKEILLKQIQQEPEPITKLVPDMPEELGAVISKMMRKKPDERYRSAQGILDDLEVIRVRYHLEAHGQAASARRTKVLAVVLSLAVLALGYGVWHFAMKPPEIIDLTKNPPPPPPPPPPIEIDPNLKAGAAYGTVADKRSDLMQKLGGGVAQKWRGNEAAWLAVAADFEKIHADYPETEKGKKAKSEADEIRTTLKAKQEEWDARAKQVNDDWTKLLQEMRGHAAAGKFNAAVAMQAEAEKILTKGNLEYLTGTPAKDLQDLLREIVSSAEAAAKPLLDAAVAGASIFPGTGYMNARDALNAFRGGVAPAAGAGPARDPSSAAIHGIAKSIDDTLKSTQEKAVEAAIDALDADEAEWFKAYLGIRRWAPGDTPAFNETPFFDFKWDDAIARWEALRKVLRTKAFRDKVDLKIAGYKRCKRFFETMAAKVRSTDRKDQIFDPDFPEAVRKRSTVDLDNGRRAQATTEGLHVVRGASSTRDFVEYRVFTPRELYEDFLKKCENIQLSNEDHLDLAYFLAEAGCGDYAGQEKNIATMTGKAPVVLTPAMAEWFDREQTNYYEINGPDGPVVKFTRYRQMKESGERLERVEAIRHEIEERIREIQRKETYWTSDFSLLNESQGGPEGAVPDHILSLSAEKEILETLGVEDGRRLPAPPAPPNAPADGNSGGGGNAPPPPPTGGESPAKGQDVPPPPPPPK